jgi:hypothetical protein
MGFTGLGGGVIGQTAAQSDSVPGWPPQVLLNPGLRDRGRHMSGRRRRGIQVGAANRRSMVEASSTNQEPQWSTTGSKASSRTATS